MISGLHSRETMSLILFTINSRYLCVQYHRQKKSRAISFLIAVRIINALSLFSVFPVFLFSIFPFSMVTMVLLLPRIEPVSLFCLPFNCIQRLLFSLFLRWLDSKYKRFKGILDLLGDISIHGENIVGCFWFH